MKLRTAMMLAAAFAMTSGSVQAAAPDCDMKIISSIDVEIDPGGGVLIPLQVNGQEAWMVLRMGSGLPTIFPPSVAYLGLKPTGVHDMKFMVDDVRVDKKVKVGHIVIGKVDFTDWDMYVLPERGGAGARLQMYHGKPVLGNLTSRFMQVVDVELNLAEKKMNFFTLTRCQGRAVYWGGEFTAVPIYSDRSGLMAFPMELDGKAVETSFATGSRFSMLDAAVTRKFYGFDETSEGITREILQGGREVSFRAMALSAKGLAVNNARVQLFSGKGKQCGLGNSRQQATGSHVQAQRESGAIGYTDCINITPFAIGTDLLRKLRIYIAPKEHTIYFTRADSAVPSGAPAATAAGSGGSEVGASR